MMWVIDSKQMGQSSAAFTDVAALSTAHVFFPHCHWHCHWPLPMRKAFDLIAHYSSAAWISALCSASHFLHCFLWSCQSSVLQLLPQNQMCLQAPHLAVALLLHPERAHMTAFALVVLIMLDNHLHRHFLYLHYISLLWRTEI